ncbi:MAG: hypothetical protein H0U57_13710 [Tatlockia sp.]|nr:hypothetical protein [Tatlockia sp.]
MYKLGSPRIAGYGLRDSSFMEIFIDIRNLGIFYGTQVDGKRDKFLPTVEVALLQRIATPIMMWKKDLKSCFFKPYVDKKEGVNAIALGLAVPLLTVLTGLGVALAAFSPPCLLILFTLPAFIELAAGIVGLFQAAWHQFSAIHYRNDANKYNHEQELAKSYFLDSAVHFALILPLAFVTLVSTPFELIRFITRSVSTLVDQITPKRESKEELEIEDEMSASYAFNR